MQDVSGELVVENEVGRMNCPYCDSSPDQLQWETETAAKPPVQRLR